MKGYGNPKVFCSLDSYALIEQWVNKDKGVHEPT